MLAVVVLAIEAYLGYRWYERYYGVAAEVSSAPGDEAAGPEGSRIAGVLVHRAGPENVVDNSTYVDHPVANGNPDAVLLVTRVWDADGSLDTHPTGVWYDENRGGRWAIFNQDLAPMPQGATFNVMVLEDSGGEAFVHRATPSNTDGASTYVDHPLANAAPDASLLVTPNWNPGGGAGTYDDHEVGVWYDAGKRRWAIRNEDLAPMPDRVALNVSVRSKGSSREGT